MPITAAQNAAVKEVINAILAATAPKGKRQLAGMFLELVDRGDWPEYYELIPEPRCLNNIKAGVEKGRYKAATDIYTDLSLVFWNALFYNEGSSQIATDAKTLKILLESEWKKRPVLPPARTSPPPSSAQKVHATGNEEEEEAEEGSSGSPSTSGSGSGSGDQSYTPQAATATAPATRTTTQAQAQAASTTLHPATFQKPVAIRPKNSPAPPAGQDMDVDIMTPETPAPAAAATGAAGGDVRVERDPESDQIVEQLERGLPRWPGFGEEGWAEDLSDERIVELVGALKSHKDVAGNRLATALEVVPDEPFNPYLSYPHALSLKSIETQAKSKSFRTSKDFDLAMARLFEKGRRWHKIGSEGYGWVVTLQRLYQALLSPTPPLGPPYHSPTFFSTLRAGPGTVKPVHGGDTGEGVAGVTTHRVLTKDRTFVDRIEYKGWSVRLADWVHLVNADDAARPVIGQVFRCWVGDDVSKGTQYGVTVSWYYRPEQTYHSAGREFWEGEVFKTSHFADHPIEDLLEKVACQFTARHIRGRPRPPFWYLGFPLYVCDSRYNDRDRVFVKIKNWNSCVPEEVRKSDEFMPIYPFERTVFPGRMGSPFIGRGGGGGKVKGPGGLISGGDTLGSSGAGLGGGLGVGLGVEEQQESLSTNGRRTSRRLENQAKVPAAGSITAPAVQPVAATPTIAAAGGPPPPPPAGSYYASAQYGQYATAVPVVPARAAGGAGGPDRSVLTAAGGMAALGTGAVVEKLPLETAQHFDRDPDTNQVLWFGAPPVDVARPVKPRYSLAYLEFLAGRRKREREGEEGRGGGNKRVKVVPPTMTECFRKALGQVERERERERGESVVV